MSYTPGPWRIGNLESYDAYTGKPFRNVWAGDGDVALTIARAIDNGDVDANAALVAAAPDLLAACQGVNELMTRFCNGEAAVGSMLRQIRDAIVKATGESL